MSGKHKDIINLFFNCMAKPGSEQAYELIREIEGSLSPGHIQDWISPEFLKLSGPQMLVIGSHLVGHVFQSIAKDNMNEFPQLVFMLSMLNNLKLHQIDKLLDNEPTVNNNESKSNLH